MSSEELLELFRSQDPGALRQVVSVLDDAGIAHRMIGEDEGFDLTSIGSGDDHEKTIQIRKSDYEPARKALEEDSLKTDIPADHHLHHSSNDDLFEIITHASEWSPFDVAHSRRLLGERGIEIAKLEEDRQAKIDRLEKGKPAPTALIFLGWIFCLPGGFLGILTGLFLSQKKDQTPFGEFHRYDEPSRRKGELMLKIGGLIFVISLVVRFVI